MDYIKECKHVSLLCETSTLINFIKSCLATGILAMPLAFSSAGLLLGTIGTIIISAICTHCAYMLVASAHELCKKSGRTALTYADVAEEACQRGPEWFRKHNHLSRKLVEFGIFVTYFGICSAYTVIMAKNFEKVTSFYLGPINIRLYIIILLIPLLILCYIPDLKYLTPVCTMANIFMGLGLGITMHYLVKDAPSTKNRELVAEVSRFPNFFSITIFALQAIGCVMPLENKMKRPHKMIGPFGVLNQAMIIITTVYILLGFLGYLRYGDETLANITLNLPNDEYIAQAVQILVGLSVYGTFGIQFFICLQIAWDNIERRYKNSARLANYILRTVMGVTAIIIAIAVPTIGPFISLIGAFCFSIMGILVPIFIKIVTFWEEGFGKYHWVLIKDVIVLVTGILALIFGTKDALLDILKLYTKN